MGLGDACKRLVQGKSISRVRRPCDGGHSDQRGQRRKSHRHGNTPIGKGQRPGTTPASRQAAIGGRKGASHRPLGTRRDAVRLVGSMWLIWEKTTGAAAVGTAWPQQWAK